MDCYIQHSRQIAHPVRHSGDDALGLYDSHQQLNARKTNNPINISEKQGRRKFETKCISILDITDVPR